MVSDNIRGRTNTLPLQIELFYDDGNPTGAFVAAIVTLIAMAALSVKAWLEGRREV